MSIPTRIIEAREFGFSAKSVEVYEVARDLFMCFDWLDDYDDPSMDRRTRLDVIERASTRIADARSALAWISDWLADERVLADAWVVDENMPPRAVEKIVEKQSIRQPSGRGGIVL